MLGKSLGGGYPNEAIVHLILFGWAWSTKDNPDPYTISSANYVNLLAEKNIERRHQ